ncbi:integrin alpha-M-like [Myxocyprinus asiaticus]|uniref:integrin alpha-M-like n=1 Tax=Myxocyprinus asiaticus TaxID=70543 RepID=UPI0022227774|nr:integrin alpha-M-like [Myxocyprinus asiaticus]
MDHNFLCISLCIFCVSQSMMAFNIDPATWRSFRGPSQLSNVAFGYKIIQNESKSVIASDPLIQINQDRRGQIYSCSVTQRSCSPLNIKVPSEAFNMSLGLSMTQDLFKGSSELAICGPTIPKICAGVTTYNGMCFVSENKFDTTIPTVLRDCPGQIDIAFLLDGSGSVTDNDFNKMKTFVINMIERFTGRNAQFAIAQYSSSCDIHYNFNELKDSKWKINIMNIQQMHGGTSTAKAIIKVLDYLFTNTGGARAEAKQILLVITDGESFDRHLLPKAASDAQAKNITRFAIGVGNAFDNHNAKWELNTIASDPDIDYVFKVTNFDALNNILQKLEENIIAIEGTQTSGDSSKMEFAQDGFSTAFSSYGSVLLSTVGAYQWKGGYEEYFRTNSFQSGTEHDSYLGYSVATAKLSSFDFAYLGAPRYKHQGQVIVRQLRDSSLTSTLDSPQPQIGSYFGAEVCVVDLNSDSNTDLLLVSAPTYTMADGEGKVFVYSLSPHKPYATFSRTVLVGIAGQWGRFGSSLASPADLNDDGFRDVLIGAPFEEDRQGSIYIFNGRNGVISSTYSQRIVGSSVERGLQYFGISLSQLSLDQSGDNLPDIAVGSMGAFLLLRSRPIMRLETKVTYRLSKIPTSESDCPKTLENTLTVCFTMSAYKHAVTGLSANINYTIKLDAKREKFRAYFSPKNRVLNVKMTIRMTEKCSDHRFSIDVCSEDALNPLSNQLTFIFEGLPSSMEGLRPVLLPEIKNTTDYNLDFEINCGTDNICVDEIRMDFNFSGSTNIEVGIMQEINVTVFVENRGENSYNTDFTLKYPLGLSYRRITSKQGRVECVSLDGEQGVSLGETICHISSPILKTNAQVVFEITYSINKESMFGQNVTFSAVAKSGNDKHSVNSELSKGKTIGVKYAINIVLIRHENSSIHINFTAGKKPLQRPVQQILQVENELRELIFKVFIRVPVKLGNIDIWKNPNLQISGCEKKMTEKPVVTNFIEVIKKQHVVNCFVAACEVFSCDVNLLKNEKKLYYISDNVSSGWIEQTGLRAAVFQLVSTASLDYDMSKYIFFSTDSQHTAPTVQINTQVEVYEEVNLTKEIIGGVIGGLLLLALITAALYKAGFFKSQYKQMLQDAQEDAGGEPVTAQ